MHIVFFNVLGSGHVNPTLPVVRALVARGDRVTYFTYPERRRDVEAAGATFHNYGRDDFRVADYNPEGRFPTQLFPAAVGLMPYLLARMAELQPDHIIADSCAPWGAAVAQALDIPLLGSITTFVFTGDQAARMRKSGKMELDEANRQALDTLEQQWGISFERADFPFFSAEHNVVYTGQAFNPPIENQAGRFEFVGPMISSRATAPEFPTAHYAQSPKKCVYISMGSILGAMHGLDQAFYQPFFDALGHRDDCEVVVSVGKSVDPANFQAPSNVRLARFVPQLELLRHVDVFVTHGGMNSANEALYYGVPLLVIPFFGDQPIVAERVRDLGAGLVMDHRTLTTTAIETAVDRLLSDPTVRQAAALIRDDLRAGSGVDGVLSLLTK